MFLFYRATVTSMLALLLPVQLYINRVCLEYFGIPNFGETDISGGAAECSWSETCTSVHKLKMVSQRVSQCYACYSENYININLVVGPFELFRQIRSHAAP
jgi:hypothetical protein